MRFRRGRTPMDARIARRVLTLAAGFGLLAGPAWAQTSTLYLMSQPGDYVGGGQTVTYTDADGAFTASGIGANTVEFSFTSSDSAHFWYVDLAAVRDQPVVPGMYEGATRYPFQSPTHAGLDISGDGRGCNESTGRFVVLEASFDAGGNVLSFAADFE